MSLKLNKMHRLVNEIVVMLQFCSCLSSTTDNTEASLAKVQCSKQSVRDLKRPPSLQFVLAQDRWGLVPCWPPPHSVSVGESTDLLCGAKNGGIHCAIKQS